MVVVVVVVVVVVEYRHKSDYGFDYDNDNDNDNDNERSKDFRSGALVPPLRRLTLHIPRKLMPPRQILSHELEPRSAANGEHAKKGPEGPLITSMMRSAADQPAPRAPVNSG